MDLSKLNAFERLAAYGAIATVIGGVVAAASYPGHWGVAWLVAILGLAMLAVVFLPQLSPDTKLPGKKGSLMVIVGGVAALLMALIFLTTIAFTFEGFDVSSFLFLVALAGALVMGWAGWQAFQAEGGKFDIGMAGASSVPPVPMVPPPAPPPSASPTEAPGSEDEDRA
jgi:vacuolar-type H+-ATPase subunit I/STV1